jgi:hypothetical protein
VIILDEMCVLSLIYSFVALSMFCALRCVVIVGCNLLFCNCLAFVCNILYVFVLCLLYTAVPFLFLYKFTDHCHRVETNLQYINIISYHIISYIMYHIPYITLYIVYHIYHIVYLIIYDISYPIIYHVL